MSLREFDLPVVTIKTVEQLGEVYRFVTSSDEAKKYKTICLDSISEIAEVILDHELVQNADRRRAYGELQIRMVKLIKAFRDLSGKDVYFSAKQERQIDGASNMILNTPSFPGSKIATQLPYLFDLIMAMRAEKTSEGELKRVLQTVGDEQYIAKDRSGTLAMYEVPDLGAIFKKVKGE